MHLSGKRGPAPYFTNYVKQQLIDRYGSGPGVRRRAEGEDDDRPRTSSSFARQAITKWLTDPNGPSAALVAVDPRNGKVLGDDRRQQLPQEPVQPRRPGRAPAGLVLQAVRARDGARAGISPDDDVRVRAGRRFRSATSVWYVHNYENSDLGRIYARDARPSSRTTRSTRSSRSSSGRRRSSELRSELGITSPLKTYFAIGLGAEAVNPLEMARAFSTFANRRRRVDGAVFGNRPRRDLGCPQRDRAGRRRQPCRSSGPC